MTVLRDYYGAPKRISSRMTVFQKKVFPFVWFGFLGVFVLVAVGAQFSPGGPGPFILLPPILMGFVGFLIMKKLIFELVDEVWDTGSALLIINDGRELRVDLAEIINVSHSSFTNPPRVTLTFRHPKEEWGKGIAFMPPTVFNPFASNPMVEELIRRVDDARRRAGR
jgi:hypothetical protein